MKLKNKKILVIIQARQTSTRFKNKVLNKIGKFTLIELMLKRLKKSKIVNDIVFAIPSNKKNLDLRNHLNFLKAKIYLGSEKNVLKRYYEAAKYFKATHVIRLTSDCPLIDSTIIDEMIKKFFKLKLDYINNASPYLSDGFDVEIFSFKALKNSYFKVRSDFDKEHVTPYIKKSSKFKKLSAGNLNNYGVKLSIDYKSDLKKVKKIFKYFHPDILFPVKKIFENEKLRLKFFSKEIKQNNILQNKTKNGQELWKKASNLISGGNMLLSKNPSRYLPGVWPTYFKSARGCRVEDLDGNIFKDFSSMGVGTNLLGYSNKFVDSGVKRMIAKGTMSTLNCPEEVQLAEKILDIHPWFDKVKFARTGGEANSVAIRIARAASNRDNVAICGYHGWHDWYLSANLNSKLGNNLDTHLLKGLNISGVPKKLKNTIFPFEYNDFKSLEKIVKFKNIGVIKMEVCRNTQPNISFLKKVRRLATKNNIVLIFDECTTGFRESFGGLHKNTGVKPDMAIFGKALGNGYAITAILGKSSVMDCVNKSFISSTFWTERVGPTAALRTIEFMEKEKTWLTIKKIGKKIQSNWRKLAAEYNLDINIKGIPSLTSFSFKGNKTQEYKTLITQEMLKKNFLATNAVYCSISHNDRTIQEYFERLADIFKIIKDCENGHSISKFLSSKVSEKEFRRLN